MTRSSRRQSAPTVTVYNSTDGPLPYDAEGRVIGARETAEVPAVVNPDTRLAAQAVDTEPIKGHVDGGRFILIEDQPAEDASDDQTQTDGGDAGDTQEA